MGPGFRQDDSGGDNNTEIVSTAQLTFRPTKS
jgi:hypothetical protein